MIKEVVDFSWSETITPEAWQVEERGDRMEGRAKVLAEVGLAAYERAADIRESAVPEDLLAAHVEARGTALGRADRLARQAAARVERLTDEAASHRRDAERSRTHLELLARESEKLRGDDAPPLRPGEAKRRLETYAEVGKRVEAELAAHEEQATRALAEAADARQEHAAALREHALAREQEVLTLEHFRLETHARAQPHEAAARVLARAESVARAWAAGWREVAARLPVAWTLWAAGTEVTWMTEERRRRIEALPDGAAEAVGSSGGRTYWFVGRRLYATEDPALTADDVAALAYEAEARRRSRLEKAHARKAMHDAPDPRRRKPIPVDVRLAVWRHDGGRCTECGGRENLEYDHLIPVAMGGSNTERNLQLLCESCNRRKGATLG